MKMSATEKIQIAFLHIALSSSSKESLRPKEAFLECDSNNETTCKVGVPINVRCPDFTIRGENFTLMC